MPTVDQYTLIDQFIRYISLQRKKNGKTSLSFFQKKIMQGGLCFGFSVVHAYMAATGKLRWWKMLLSHAIAVWDGDEKSLAEVITLVDERPEKPRFQKTRDYYFQQAIHYVLFHHANSFLNKLSSLTQANLFSHNVHRSGFVSESGKVAYEYCFTEKKWGIDKFTKMLNSTTLRAKETMCLLYFYNYLGQPTHTCSLRYDNAQRKFAFYDPSARDGEIYFMSIEALFLRLTFLYQFSFDMRVISYDPAFVLNSAEEYTISKIEKLHQLREIVLILIMNQQHCASSLFSKARLFVFKNSEKRSQGLNSLLLAIEAALLSNKVSYVETDFDKKALDKTGWAVLQQLLSVLNDTKAAPSHLEGAAVSLKK